MLMRRTIKNARTKVKGAMSRVFMFWGQYFLKSKLGAFSYTQNGLRTPRRHERNS